MHIITSKTDEAIRSQFSRRCLLKFAGSAALGLTIFSTAGVSRLAFGQSIFSGAIDFFENFGKFALGLGLQAVGSQVRKWLPSNPLVDSALQGFIRGLNGYSPYDDFQMAAGLKSAYIPIFSQKENLPMIPFFSLSDGQLATGMKWFSAASLPEIGKILAKNDGMPAEERAAYLLPRKPQCTGYSNVLLPETFATDNGTIELNFMGDERRVDKGEVNFVVYSNSRGSLKKVLRKGKLGVELYV